jgi:ribosomal protein S18 acetylase RimI-like enzyme
MEDVDGRNKSGHDEEGRLAPFGWSRAAQAGLTFRTITDADLPFLARVYASTRWEELSVVAWSDDQKRTFLQQQFDAQHAHWQKHYYDTDWLLVLHDGAPVRRLYLSRWAREHRIVDIALLPEHRGAGLGTALLTDLLDEAAAAAKAVTIHVEKFNPAMSLYRRLGFVAAGEEGAYDLMRWQPGSSAWLRSAK